MTWPNLTSRRGLAYFSLQTSIWMIRDVTNVSHSFSNGSTVNARVATSRIVKSRLDSINGYFVVIKFDWPCWVRCVWNNINSALELSATSAATLPSFEASSSCTWHNFLSTCTAFMLPPAAKWDWNVASFSEIVVRQTIAGEIVHLK